MFNSPNIAAPIALARAVKNAGIKLLEPILYYIISFDSKYCDNILSSIIHFKYTYTDLYNSDGRMYLCGNALVSEIDEISKKLKKMTGGDASIEYYQSGYALCRDNTIIKNDVSVPYNPYDISSFLEVMGGSRINLDRGLSIEDNNEE